MSQENVEVIRHGVLRNATAPYGKVLDVNHIIQSASFPLTEFKTTIKHGSYIAAKCPASPWHIRRPGPTTTTRRIRSAIPNPAPDHDAVRRCGPITRGWISSA